MQHHDHNRRFWLKSATAAALTAGGIAAPVQALAQARPANWPRRPLRILVGFPAGTSPDLIARALAEPLGKELGQTVVVENKTGASGSLAAGDLAKTRDDHTIGVVGNAALTSNPILYPKLPYELTEFNTLTVVGTSPWLIVGAASLNFSTPADFFKLAREAGNKWSYGSVGIGSGTHLGNEMLKDLAGFDAVHVPFNGAPAVISAMKGGDIHMASLPMGFALAQAQAGTIKAVAVTSAARTPLAPNVPALPEAGVPAMDLEIRNAMVVPASMPRDIADAISAALTRIIRSDDVKQKLFQQGWVADGGSPEQAQRRIRSDTAHYQQIITKRKITVAG